MCESCLAGPADPRTRRRRHFLAAWPIIAILVAGLVALFGPRGALGRAGDDGDPLNRADQVFLQDLASQAEGGLRLGDRVASSGGPGSVRAVGAALSNEDRLERRSALALAGGHEVSLRAVEAQRGRTAQARLATVMAHSRDNVVLARIELRSGGDPEIKRLAARVSRRHAAITKGIAALTRQD